MSPNSSSASRKRRASTRCRRRREGSSPRRKPGPMNTAGAGSRKTVFPGPGFRRDDGENLNPSASLATSQPMTSTDFQTEARAANLDEALGFTIPARNARGRLVRLGPLLGHILSAHDYPAP